MKKHYANYMYNKIFTKILDSSIWLEPTTTRLVWLTFIAAMDEEGMVRFASVANLAHRARVTLKEAQAAVACLEGPDENSSDPDNGGRRIERVPGGWLVINANKYRDIVTRAVEKEMNRARVARHREKAKKSEECNGAVTPGNESVTQSEAETAAKAEAFQPPIPAPASPPLVEKRKRAKKQGVIPTDPIALRLGGIFRRRHNTAWDASEIESFNSISPIEEEDLALMEWYYGLNDPTAFYRLDLLTLMNNFQRELDKARAKKAGRSNQPRSNGYSQQRLPAQGYDHSGPDQHLL